MADRFLFKKFASETNDVGQFGSFQATGGNVGDGVKTTDPDLIQSLPAWKAGWGNAVDNGLLLPRLEEMNGVQRVFAEMLWNQWRDGITFWQAGAPVKALQSIVMYQTGDEKPKLYINKTGVNGTNPPPHDTDNWKPLNDSVGGEIGDIGFAPLGIDESLNLRRYLNGQVISQSQFVSFTNKVKSAIALYPNLAATETNWQAEKTNSKLGQCGKFVVDDTAGTIRLPCVVNAQGLADLALIGEIKSESLPNFQANLGDVFPHTETSGAVTSTKKTVGWTITAGRNVVNGDTTINPSVTSSTYQDNAPVQQEAVQYPYYIQVATGVEETLPAIREYNINTPFFFGQSMYSDVAPDNASWLASNGQYNAKTVYPDYYDWLLEQLNAGVDGFKGTVGYAWKSQTADIRFWTAIRNPSVGCAVYVGVGVTFAGNVTAINPDGTLNFYEDSTGIAYENLVYTEYENINIEGTAFANLKFANDYDFVINTADQTFRLPLKNGQEGIFADGVKGNGMTLGISDGTNLFGFSVSAPQPNSNNRSYSVSNSLGALGEDAAINTTAPYPKYYGISTDPTKSGMIVDKTVPSGWNLYYYVGDTVQDASLINAGAVLGQLANVNAASRGYVVESYHNGTEWYRIYSDGWCEQGGLGQSGSGEKTITLYKPYANANYTIMQTPYSSAGAGSYSSAIKSQTNTSFVLAVESNFANGFYWQACGY